MPKRVKKTITLGITAGDPNGIGPEVALKAALFPPVQNIRLVLIGHASIWQHQAKSLRLPCPPEVDILRDKHIPDLCTWDPDMAPAAPYKPGHVDAAAALAARSYIISAVHAAQNQYLDGIVTAPISKEAFQRAGFPEPGHTELLASLTQTRRYAMLLFGKQLRVVLATRHLPLRDVAEAVTPDSVFEAIEMLRGGLRWLGFTRARIGVCALNPHAGDGGALGTEEKTHILPAIQKAQQLGWDVTGPIPADAIFYQHLHKKYDGVVAMYHDQGLGPLKMLSFEDGVNLTLGLPIIRTSPDHGTAFEIAAKKRGNPASMQSAIHWAAKLAARSNPWKPK